MKCLWVILFIISHLIADDDLETYVKNDFNILISELSEFEEEIIDYYIEFMSGDYRDRTFVVSNSFYRLSKNPTDLIQITTLIKNTRLIDIRLKGITNEKSVVNKTFINIYNSTNEKLLIEHRTLLLCKGIQLVEDFQIILEGDPEWKSMLEEYVKLLIRIGVQDMGTELYKSRNESFKLKCKDLLSPQPKG